MSIRILKRSEYKAILQRLESYPPLKALEYLRKDFPSVNPKTLWSIKNVLYTEKMKKNTIILKRKHQFITQIYDPLLSCLKNADPQTLLRIADKFDISPSLVAKRVLEEYYSTHQVHTSVALEGTGIKNPAEKKAPVQQVTKATPVYSDTHVAILYMYSAIEKVPLEFNWVSSEGPGHRPIFTAHLTLSPPDQTPLVFTDSAHTKNSAKQAAAMKALETLILREDLMTRYQKIKQETPSTTSQQSTPGPEAIALLSKFAPHFDVMYSSEGPPNKPIFTATLTVKMIPANDDLTVTACGLSKKEAKQNAAYNALLKLPLPPLLQDELDKLKLSLPNYKPELTDEKSRSVMGELTYQLSHLSPQTRSNDTTSSGQDQVTKVPELQSHVGSAFTAVGDKENKKTQTSIGSQSVSYSDTHNHKPSVHNDTENGTTSHNDSDLTLVEEDPMQFAGKKTISLWMREPHRIPDKDLSRLVTVCVSTDTEYGPIAMAMQASVGHEFEFKLIEHIKKHNIHYQDENYLRKAGYDKTPDIKLDVPIAVDGKVINWIESKAIFADEKTHKKYLDTQLWSYWNRFGAGLVIYWFGYIDDIEDNTEKGILVRDDFPDNITVMSCFSNK